MAGINRPLPAHSEPNGRNPSFGCNCGVASSVQQDRGPHSATQDPGFPLHSQHPIFPRPVFYIHAPPPPPLLPYQWPMPFSYNPFAGFPNMGYGMIAPPPPFPPPTYMEAPGYILPHPHIQPVDYRRLHHPQPHTQGASHQNPNQTRRIRQNHFIPVRETVNSEVQTEPAQSGIHGYDLGSDSGRGTFSNSPCSPVLSSPKQTSTEVVNSKSPRREEKDLDLNEPCTNATVKNVESCGVDTFLKSVTHEEPERHSLTFTDEEQDLQNSSHISSAEVQENDIGTYLQEISDVAPHVSARSCQGKRKLNESIWSVESLAPCIPSREWMLQSGMVEPKVNDVMEEAENVGLSNKNANMVIKERRSRSLSSCVSVPMSESYLCSSIQEEEHSPVKETGTETEKDVSELMEPEQSQSTVHSEKNVLSSSALPSKARSTPTEKDDNKNRSSEPEASQSPNQKSLILNELQQESLSSSEEEEEMFLNSPAEEIASSAIQLISQNGVDIEDGGDLIMVQNMAEVSASKGTLVDCGVQCNEFHDQMCLCGKMIKSTESNRRHPFKSSDMKKGNDGRNGQMQKRNSQWRSTGQEGQFKQQEAHSGYCRGGKSKGGRHPRYY